MARSGRRMLFMSTRRTTCATSFRFRAAALWIGGFRLAYDTGPASQRGTPIVLTGGPPMRTLITGGTIVNADATTRADVLVDGERIALIGTDLEATADATIDATRQVGHPRRDRCPHPHAAAVRRHVREGHVRDRHARRGLRRDDHDHRLRRPAARRLAAPGTGRLAREGRRQGVHRLRLPHDHQRRPRRRPGRDGQRSSTRA